MLYNLIAWIFSQTAHAPIVYFGVTWYPILNVFPVSLWEGGIAKFMTSESNNTLLPANVDRPDSDKLCRSDKLCWHDVATYALVRTSSIMPAYWLMLLKNSLDVAVQLERNSVAWITSTSSLLFFFQYRNLILKLACVRNFCKPFILSKFYF